MYTNIHYTWMLVITKMIIFLLLLDCPLSRFGHNCDKECHCSGGIECDSIMGICKSEQCALGWTGFDCQTREYCFQVVCESFR